MTKLGYNGLHVHVYHLHVKSRGRGGAICKIRVVMRVQSPERMSCCLSFLELLNLITKLDIEQTVQLERFGLLFFFFFFFFFTSFKLKS